ncbi:MAG: hypothetical protein AAB502_06460, partial [Chloroflexota bacterium]
GAATIWTFDSNGELRDECAVNMGHYVAGVQIDEDGKLYFAAAKSGRTKMCGAQRFLFGRGGRYGVPADKLPPDIRNPFTGTYMKTAGRGVRFLFENAPIPLDPPPARPKDLDGGWMEGAEWLYAGASPVVESSCSCPTMRSHLDWYKRSYVPEAYRHSLGILDSAGNLILHVGRYGNHDDALQMKAGDTAVAMTMVRFVSGTDNYLVFEDNGERLVVLKLNYHAEETVPIRAK